MSHYRTIAAHNICDFKGMTDRTKVELYNPGEIVIPDRVHNRAVFLGLLENVRKGEMIQETFSLIIHSILLKTDISIILQENAIAFESREMKAALCDKLLALLFKKEPVAIETPSSPESPAGIPDVQLKCPPNLSICDSPLAPLPNKAHLLMSDLEDWKTNCTCETNKDALLSTIDQTLPGTLLGLLVNACYSHVSIILVMLFDFGERNLKSGCRNLLLLQIIKRFHEFNAQLNVAKNQPNSACVGISQLETNTGAARPCQDETPNAVCQMSLTLGQNFLKFFRRTQEGQVFPECCICFDGSCEVAFSPCGHATCCKKCANKLSKCPICVQVIANKLELFFP